MIRMEQTDFFSLSHSLSLYADFAIALSLFLSNERKVMRLVQGLRHIYFKLPLLVRLLFFPSFFLRRRRVFFLLSFTFLLFLPPSLLYLFVLQLCTRCKWEIQIEKSIQLGCGASARTLIQSKVCKVKVLMPTNYINFGFV